MNKDIKGNGAKQNIKKDTNLGVGISNNGRIRRYQKQLDGFAAANAISKQLSM